MAHYFSDCNVHSTAFTPRDYQVELLAAALEQNLMICIGQKSSREFISLKLIQELSRNLKKSNVNKSAIPILNSIAPQKKYSIYLTNQLNESSAFNLIYHLTDLNVCLVEDTTVNDINDQSGNDFKGVTVNNDDNNFNNDDDDDDSNSIKGNTDNHNDTTSSEQIVFENYQVLILKPKTFLHHLKSSTLKLCDINLIIIEDCHNVNIKNDLWEIFNSYYVDNNNHPKILALASPLHSGGCKPNQLNEILKIFEKNLHCKTETASDIVTVLRYCSKPHEYILECSPLKFDELVILLANIINTRKKFIEDHRYDPSEIYSDEFLEELKNIPDPKVEPLEFLDDYLEVLYEMGPWCADRIALNLLAQIEKQKIKTPYERHFLLLCLVSTTLVEVRSFCEYAFNKCSNDLERVLKFSSPKIHRLIEILRAFKPLETKTDNKSLEKYAKDLEKMDFQKIKNAIELQCQQIGQTNRDARDVLEHLGNIVPEELNTTKTEDIFEKSNNAESTRSKIRADGKSRRILNSHRPKRAKQRRFKDFDSENSNQLCGILFCDKKSIAKVLFDLLCELSRHDPQLIFLCVQFTVDRVADPITEPKEAELEHRRQEEVLKRFRLRDCNLLIGTSVLEEGIDLPKCNLVIRWNPPKTYRSYVQCKGRARASHAHHVILVNEIIRICPDENSSTDANETLTDYSHRYICSEKTTELFNKSIDQEDNLAKHKTVDQDSNENFNKKENVVLLKSTEVPLPQNHVENRVNNHIEEEEPVIKIDDTEKIEKKSFLNNLENHIEDMAIGNCTGIVANNDSTNILKENSNKKNRESCCCILSEKYQSNDYCSSFNSLDNINSASNEVVNRLAEYKEIEKILLKKCSNCEPVQSDHTYADQCNGFIEPYKTLPNLLTSAYVDLSSSITLVNKYCAKLPSDTFTKLTPIWRLARSKRKSFDVFQYTIRLPINSPLKYDITGIPMPTEILARRVAALMTCKELHELGELDNNLQPIGKETFRASESDWETFDLDETDSIIVNENLEPRPGTTKRRQYYYKRIASEFSDCRPTNGTLCYLYFINLTLQCPIPEEQNTRGRKIYPPEEAFQGFGILTLKEIPKISSFPIFTRSGEVKVSIELCKNRISLTEEQISLIHIFVNYTFTNVLRLQKFLMLYDPEATENSIFIVPTVKTQSTEEIKIDWNFLDLIFKNSDKMPTPVPDENRKNKEFDANRFKDAVVMPWYRNQDQPQYFYVAEICYHLSPESSFPGENYRTFQEYYFLKYGITIQNTKQPLLDVDHTSARLNFLTPRYVNRKGVALPTSSEETKKAKRENLEQKQILVPELCTIHPFPASLWRAAVALPCILYRINGLLLADEIRRKVSFDLGLGSEEITDEFFEWPMLDFGWSLSEVLKKCRESKKSTFEDQPKLEEILSENKNCKPDELDNKKIESDSEKQELKTANDILDEADKKLKADSFIEIGTWSNDMADNIDGDIDDEDDWGLLPPNINICSTNNTNIRYGSPTSWDVDQFSSVNNKQQRHNNDKYYSESENSYQSDYEYDARSNLSENQDNPTSGSIRIEFKSNNVAEAIETEEELIKRQKQLAIIQESSLNEKQYELIKSQEFGYQMDYYISEDMSNQFKESIEIVKNEIWQSKMIRLSTEPLELIKKETELLSVDYFQKSISSFQEAIFPYLNVEEITNYFCDKNNGNFDPNCITISLSDLKNLNLKYLGKSTCEKYVIKGAGSSFDNFNDTYVNGSTNIVIDFMMENKNMKDKIDSEKNEKQIFDSGISDANLGIDFSFDYQPNLMGHPGPSPSIILQALTMSNANDGINLERLETIGDSFLKYAITSYLYCTYENVHEGKLSHLRSKQVSNLNLYRLGRRKVLGECMIATKFEPHDNWLPPCYYVPKELEKALIEAKIPPNHWNLADLPNIKDLNSEQICELVRKKAESLGLLDEDDMEELLTTTINDDELNEGNFTCFIPYNLVTQHSIPDKSIADCVEALIGAYLIDCGPRGALLFMAWLGIRVLPIEKLCFDSNSPRKPGSTRSNERNEIFVYGEWKAPKSPLLKYSLEPYKQLEHLLDGFDQFEHEIGYFFKDRSYLLQAMTHASYSPNRLTDCYQRLEFLGDAVLDYLITRHLYEDPRQHSPGALTDLRSALVNNTIFASLAVRHGFHKYFRHLSPGLNEVIDRFVRIQHENGHLISEEYYLLSEEECDDAEDVEVPKALGDVFESVAGAIFLDSNMSLDTVWKVYSNMMKPEIEQFSNSVPKSPIRELLELEPETAKFGRPEKLADGRRVRVTVEVFGKGIFRGIGRNYRIAKCTAAKCALRQLKKQGLLSKKH